MSIYQFRHDRAGFTGPLRVHIESTAAYGAAGVDGLGQGSGFADGIVNLAGLLKAADGTAYSAAGTPPGGGFLPAEHRLTVYRGATAISSLSFVPVETAAGIVDINTLLSQGKAVAATPEQLLSLVAVAAELEAQNGTFGQTLTAIQAALADTEQSAANLNTASVPNNAGLTGKPAGGYRVVDTGQTVWWSGTAITQTGPTAATAAAVSAVAATLPAVRVASVAAMKARANDGRPVQTDGYIQLGLGGGVYDPLPPGTLPPANVHWEQGADVHTAADGTVYKLRRGGAALRASQCGALGDWGPGNLSADDTAALQRLSRSMALDYLIDLARARITDTVRFGINALTDTEMLNCRVRGLGRGATKIVVDIATAGRVGRGGIELGGDTLRFNTGHSISGMDMWATYRTHESVYLLTAYSNNGVMLDTVGLFGHNCLNLNRPGGYGWFYTNARVRNLVAWTRHAYDAGGYEDLSGPETAGWCINNVGGEAFRHDDTQFENISTNGPFRLGGLLVKLNGWQGFNEYRRAWQFDWQTNPASVGPYDSDMADTRVLTMWFTEGALEATGVNLEPYQIGVLLGDFNKQVDRAEFKNCNMTGVGYVNNPDHGAIGVLLKTGGAGSVKNVTFDGVAWEMNQFADVYVDSTSLGSNGQRLVDGVNILPNCESRPSPFSFERAEPFTVADSATVTFPDDRLSRQFKGINNIFEVQALGAGAGGYRPPVGAPITAHIIGFPSPNSVLLDRKITVTNGQYSRIVGRPIVRGNADLLPGQVVTELQADAPPSGRHNIGDTITRKTLAAGEWSELVCVQPGGWRASVGETVTGQQRIYSVTNIEQWSTGDAVFGAGIPSGATVGGVVILGPSVAEHALDISQPATASAAGVTLRGRAQFAVGKALGSLI